MFRKRNSTYRFFAAFFLFFSIVESVAQRLPRTEVIAEARRIRSQNPDSSVVLLRIAHKNFLRVGDTLQAINALLEMPYVYGQQVNYAKSYDDLWQALFLADNLNNDALKASIYNRLGRLYSFFKRREEAFQYMGTALEINKGLVEEGKLIDSELSYNYYLICATYRELGEPKFAKVYLDSCLTHFSENQDHISMPYLNFEKAVILSQEDKKDEALELFQKIKPWFEENSPSYMVLIYAYWGDVYRDLSDFQKSEEYYKMALEVSKSYNSHVDFTPLVYEKLADIYIKKGYYKKAYESQDLAQELDAQFFDSRSPINRPLLEIKDEFRLEKERQERLIEKQHLERLEQQDEILLLQRVILSGAIVFLLVIGWIYLRYLRSKHRAEKQLISRNKELEMQKAEELLELKNKELAASALQLVEKEEFLKEIKSKLKTANGNIEQAEINEVLRSISHSNQNNWEEFKLRFTAVNEKFYNKVTSQYPNLSQADQKICALIKLNFSSKEMARLLGISVESVHTTRYRLRKKMGLERSVNLEDYIANI